MRKYTRITGDKDKAVIQFGSTFPCQDMKGKRLDCACVEHEERDWGEGRTWGGTDRYLYWRDVDCKSEMGWHICIGRSGYVKGFGPWLTGHVAYDKPQGYGPVASTLELTRRWNRFLRMDVEEQHDRWGNCHLCYHVFGKLPDKK